MVDTELPDGQAAAIGSAILPSAFGESVGFLASQVGSAISRRFGESLASLSLEPRHFALMRAIDDVPETTQQAVADRLHIPASSMVALLDQLEGRALLERRPYPGDRRARIVALTTRGKEVLAEAQRVAIATEQALCAGLQPDERAELISLLQRVATNLGLVLGVHPGLREEHCGPAGLRSARGVEIPEPLD